MKTFFAKGFASGVSYWSIYVLVAIAVVAWGVGLMVLGFVL